MQEKEGEEQFERMQEASGMSSTAQLVDAYVTAEAANFELFNQVAGINTQTAQLQELIGQQQLLIGHLRYASVIGQTCPLINLSPWIKGPLKSISGSKQIVTSLCCLGI